MSIGSYIRGQKEKFRQKQQERYDTDIIRRADRIAKLNQERLKLEKRADFANIEKEERAKIAAAKAASPTTLQRFAGGLKSVINKAKEAKGKSLKKNAKKGSLARSRFGSSGSQGLSLGSSGGKGLDDGGFGGSNPFGSAGSKGFSFGSNRPVSQKPKQRPKTHRREVIIRL